MAQTNSSLFDLRGRIRQFRPGIDETQVDQFINDRIKQAADFREYWSSNMIKGIISIPNAYTTGTVSVTTGSNIVTGVGCNFPVSDAVNASIPSGIVEIGYQDVIPNTMAGINYRSILYVDAADAPEAVPVAQVLGQGKVWQVNSSYGFNGEFRLEHNPNCTVTQSSLAGQQFRLGAGSPIFTVLAVIDQNTLLLDQPWGNVSLTGQAYQVYQIYFDLGQNVQAVFWVLDQIQGLPLSIHTSVRAANWQDPQRLNSGNPLNLVDAQPSVNGIIQFEVWPQQIVAYQLQFCVYEYWKPLVNDTDRLPWFINDSIFFYGALADALRWRRSKDDPYHNPRLADDYEKRFLAGLQQASNADEAKVMREFQQALRVLYPGGANFDQDHDFSSFTGDF